MAKNNNGGIMHAIRLLMIGVVFCYMITYNFPRTIHVEESSYYISSLRRSVRKCTSYCRETYADNPTKMKECIMKCVTLECEELHPNDPKEQKECIDKLYPRLTRVLTYKRNQKKG
ncbi:hypothetical protein PIB30_016476 [Stylosanthes scabra]|uniref:Uncharacterized protein n=1 Tax=Stylosanthes scabra TaxID=79078 RepID=A0ABU6Y6A2_9FABA|nr:hypothetical protein [Stylosanthes scabra]